MANGKIVYVSGDPAAITYTFAQNPDYGHRIGYIETDDFSRAFDGTGHGYTGARKKYFELTFSYVTEAQLDALQLAWVVGGDIDLYIDGVNLDGVVKMTTSPVGESQEAFIGGVYTYSFDVRFEEV